MDEQEKGTKKKDDMKVKVALRIRPLISRDMNGDTQICMKPLMKEKIVTVNDKRHFLFDAIFNIETKQDEIYDEIAKPCIQSCFEGYNSTIMAYGQTGSGKTYTMGSSVGQSENTTGIIPRVILDIFKRIDDLKETEAYIIRTTFVEIYNEEIYDLLEYTAGKAYTRNRANAATMREEKDGNILICGITEETVQTPDELFLLLERGGQRRSTSSTLMNDESSRSHAILNIMIERQASEEDKSDFFCSKFAFVDLAGSERLGRTGAQGSLMREGININKGLLALGNVIAALTDDTGKVNYIPYRESKLTRILRNSLGGNSKTWMIACISPVMADIDESLNTLKYASRARKISNTPIVNKDPQSAQIALLKQQVFKLTQEVSKFKRLAHSEGVISENIDEEGHVNVDDGGEWKELCSKLQKDILTIKQEKNKASKETNEYRTLYLELVKKFDRLKHENIKLKEQLGIDPDQEADENQEDYVSVAEDSNSPATEGIEAIMQERGRLREQLIQKDRYLKEFQDEYTNLLKISTKENEMLVSKTKEITKLESELRKLISSQAPSTDISEETKESTIIQEAQEEEEYLQRKLAGEKQLEEIKSELEQKELALEKLISTEITLEGDLGAEMENEVAERLLDLEQELQSAMKERDEALNALTKQKEVKQKPDPSSKNENKVLVDYKQKIGDLQTKISQFKKKEKEQDLLSRKVDHQKGKIEHLAADIKELRQEKLNMHKKLREESTKFIQEKNEKTKEILSVKKQLLKKNIQMNKLKNQQKKMELRFNKKLEKIKLKGDKYKKFSTKRIKGNLNKKDLVGDNDHFLEVIEEYTIKIYDFVDVESEVASADELLSSHYLKLDTYLTEISRIQVQKEQSSSTREQVQLLNDRLEQFESDVSNCRDTIEFKTRHLNSLRGQLEKHVDYINNGFAVITEFMDELSEEVRAGYLESILNYLFNEVECSKRNSNQLEGLLKKQHLELREARRIATEAKNSYFIIEKEQDRLRNEIDKRNIELLDAANEKIIMEKKGESDRIFQKRRTNEQNSVERTDIFINNLKKKLMNSEISHTNTKKLMETYRDKYNQMKSLLSRDNSNGRNGLNSSRDNTNGLSTERFERRKSSTSNSKVSSIKKKMKNLAIKLGGPKVHEPQQDTPGAKKSGSSFVHMLKSKYMKDPNDRKGSRKRRITDQNMSIEKMKGIDSFCFSTTNAVATYEAVTGAETDIPVHSLLDLGEKLVANLKKYICVYNIGGGKDLKPLLVKEFESHLTNALCSDPLNPALIYTAIKRERTIIQLWDTRDNKVAQTVRCGMEDVRGIKIIDGYLYAYGQAEVGGAVNLFEKQTLTVLDTAEKHQDVFTTNYRDGIFYNGCRNHYVRRLKFQDGKLFTLPSFDPPHYDTVTGLGWADNHLISASKDKILKIWSVDGQLVEQKMNAHKDYINVLEQDELCQRLLTADKLGNIKIWEMEDNRLECKVGLISSTGAINDAKWLSFSPGAFACASNDKSIKIFMKQ